MINMIYGFLFVIIITLNILFFYRIRTTKSSVKKINAICHDMNSSLIAMKLALNSLESCSKFDESEKSEYFSIIDILNEATKEMTKSLKTLENM